MAIRERRSAVSDTTLDDDFVLRADGYLQGDLHMSDSSKILFGAYGEQNECHLSALQLGLRWEWVNDPASPVYMELASSGITVENGGGDVTFDHANLVDLYDTGQTILHSHP